MKGAKSLNEVEALDPVLVFVLAVLPVRLILLLPAPALFLELVWPVETFRVGFGFVVNADCPFVNKSFNLFF